MTATFDTRFPEEATLVNMEADLGTIPSQDNNIDPLQVAHGVYVTVHGHFYQPPRENPYLDAIERQPSATPFHDWNERILHECYRPNAFARILNDRNELVGIVNNYEYLSFNIGATLMSWLERHDQEVYERILEADRKSCDRLNGHGNAIAQVYNHIIMPLANERDKYTQIRWGLADFRSRFQREPEGIWLAETAVDAATIEALINEGLKFVILAPSQAKRCRLLPTLEEAAGEWHEVGGGQIDPTRPYRYFLKPEINTNNYILNNHNSHHNGDRPDNNNPYIDIFFYDGPISRDMGFNDVLNSSHHFSGRLGMAIHGDHRPSQLIAVATDGETFGHHKKGTEKCIAYAFIKEFPQRGWTVTNFAHYLSLHEPLWEVELKPITAWSCSHGVDRWQDDCGCGGGGNWHQKWRRPLRDALNWLRDQLIEIYENYGRRWFRDPWHTRDEYIKVIRDRSIANVNRFLAKHQSHELTELEQIDALRLLEMQRHALLMYTSCGWFFEEISRPEGVQILRYAARAIELAGDIAGIQLEAGFIQRLALAPSNVETYKTGDEVYRQLVITAQITFKQVAAHYAISSLFANYTQHHRFYCYEATQIDYHLRSMGPLTLALGQLHLVSEITRENVHFSFAVLHLGGWDFHCCIQPFNGRRAYSEMKYRLLSALNDASAAGAILGMVQMFGDESFSLRDLFAEERHRIMRLLSQETLTRLDQIYSQVYRDNYGVIMAFHRDELPVPQELQVAAEIALTHRCLTVVKLLDREISAGASGYVQLGELEAIATEAKMLRCVLNIPQAKQILEDLILRSLYTMLQNGDPMTLVSDIKRIQRTIAVGIQLNLDLCLDRAQELYSTCLDKQIAAYYSAYYREGDQQFRQLLQLGQTLAVEVSAWLNKLV